MGFEFSNKPTRNSFCNHHWTHTWATRLHDPWGVKNWRVFFDVKDIQINVDESEEVKHKQEMAAQARQEEVNRVNRLRQNTS